MSWDRNIVIKSPQEIATLREAGRINALALDAVRQLIRPGENHRPRKPKVSWPMFVRSGLVGS